MSFIIDAPTNCRHDLPNMRSRLLSVILRKY